MRHSRFTVLSTGIVKMLAVGMVFGLLLLSACAPAADNTANTANRATNGNTGTTTTANTASTAPANTSASPASTGTTGTGTTIGVAECDNFLEKYEACLRDRVPENIRATFRSSLETQRTQFRNAAANTTPEGRASLAQSCRQATDAARQSMAAYNCQW